MDFETLELPSDWQIKPLREAYNFTKKPRGLALNGDGRVPFLPMDPIPIGRLFVTESEARLVSSIGSGTYVENGDLLIAKITPSFENGKQAIVDWARPFGFATTEVIPIQEKAGISNKFFLFHLLLHPAIRAHLAGKMDGTTGRQRLSKEVLGSYLIPLPPIDEQRKIAAVLGLVQRAIEEQQQLIEVTTELKKALLHKLFTEGLRGEAQKQTEIGPVPESWEVAPLGKLASKPFGCIQTGPFGSQLHKHEYRTDGIPVINPTHLAGNKINHEDLPRVSLEVFDRLSRHQLRTGDILFARRGEIGRHGLVSEAESGWLCGTGCFVVRVNRSDIDNRFLSYFFSAKHAVAWLEANAAGAIMPNLSNAVLQRVPVYRPRIEEQESIADALDAIENRIAEVVKKRILLTDLFRALLHHLMTAQIRVINLPSL